MFKILGHGAGNLRKPIILAVIGVMVCLAVFLLYRFEPTAASWYPKCILHHWTGLHCPGCGATRACRAILHGDLAAAVSFNPLLVIGGPVIAALLWRQHRREQFGRRASPALCWTLLALLLCYFVARNVPTPSRSWLAPGAGSSGPQEPIRHTMPSDQAASGAVKPPRLFPIR